MLPIYRFPLFCQSEGTLFCISSSHRWGSVHLYTQVAADNEVAYRLYTGCGFKEYRINAQVDSSLKLGKLVLLQATAETIQ